MKWYLLVLFFLSGVSGLMYQILWLRLLSLIFGVTVYSATTVLASFMAGLALGSFAAGKLIPTIKYPALWFGLAEILVGATALLTRPALEMTEQLYVFLYPTVAGNFVSLTLGRFLISFLILLIPTTLMGASLPLVIKAVRNSSLAYAVNTAGAIVGVAATGFYFIGNLGIEATFWLAAIINLSVGFVAIWISQRLN